MSAVSPAEAFGRALDGGAWHLALCGSRVPAVNHVRVVLVVSGSLALVWLPSMLGKADGNIVRNAGQEPGDYLAPWLLVTGGLAALSAAAYGLRVLRAHRVEQLDDPVGPAADEDAPRA